MSGDNQAALADDVVYLPQVHVRGDVASIWMVESDEELPDDFDSGLAPYRNVRSLTYRQLPAGAWLVKDFLQEVLHDLPKPPVFFGYLAFQPNGQNCSYELRANTPSDDPPIISLESESGRFLVFPVKEVKVCFERDLIRAQVVLDDADLLGAVRGLFRSASENGEMLEMEMRSVTMVLQEIAGVATEETSDDQRSSSAHERLHVFLDPYESFDNLQSATEQGSGTIGLESLSWSTPDSSRTCRLTIVHNTGEQQEFPLESIQCYLSELDLDAKHFTIRPLVSSPTVETYSLDALPHAVQAFWRVRKYRGEGTSTYRLEESRGYQLPAIVPESAAEASAPLVDETVRPESFNEILRRAHVDLVAQGKLIAQPLKFEQARRHVIVLQDLNFGFRTAQDDWGSLLGAFRPESDTYCWVVAILGRALPRVDECGQWSASDALWEELSEHHADRTVVVLSAQLLRASGIRISHRVSWERTAQDCMHAMRSHQTLKKLSSLAHVIIRIGVAGAVHFYRDNRTGELRGVLHYDPVGTEHDAFYRDPVKSGRVIGNNSVVAAAIVKALLRDLIKESERWLPPLTSEEATQVVAAGVRESIPRCQMLHNLGYPTNWSEVSVRDRRFNYSCLRDVFGSQDTSDRIAESRLSANPSWSILEEAASHELSDVALQIAEHGISKALNVRSDSGMGVFAPLMRLGNFISVEREEIESYRDLERIISHYKVDQIDKPLSIAVFGPPGSGKSFGVESVAQRVLGENIRPIVCNLSQLTSPADLASIFIQANDPALRRERATPLIFFDEFDCQLGDKDLGWLRYFLAPMEDGKFKHGLETIQLGKAIMVFAGGTSKSFIEFSRDPSISSDEERFKFALAKGPDFISRLSGHINTIGINPRNEKDLSFVIRRAIQLRGLLEKRKLTGANGHSLVQRAFLSALLQVREFKHGSRSMRIVFNTSVNDRGVIQLPSIGLLNMHVDGEQLMACFEKAIQAEASRASVS